VYRYGLGAAALPDVRRRIRDGAPPDIGSPHPTAGSVCLGVRRLLVAFNVDIDGSLAEATAIARAIRRPDSLRALGLALLRQGRVQVSMNLVDPERVGLQAAWDAVAAMGRPVGAEIVGLVPRVALTGITQELADETRASERVLEDRLG
jgi:glutamate formiminotransferase